MRKATDAVPVPVPGWLPLLAGGLLLHAGLVREYLDLQCFPYSGVERWLLDLTRHANGAQALLGAALLLPFTRSVAALLLVLGSVASIGIVLHVQYGLGLDVSRIPLFGPCELSLPVHLAAYLGLLAMGAWMLAGRPPTERTSIPVATAVPLCAAVAFLLTALLKVEGIASPPGCLWGTEDAAGNFVEDPLYRPLQWGTWLAIPVELLVAGLLFHPRTRRWGAWLGGGFLILAASALTTATLVAGRDLTRMCGCFGPLELPLGAHLFTDAMLLGLLAWTRRLAGPGWGAAPGAEEGP